QPHFFSCCSDKSKAATHQTSIPSHLVYPLFFCFPKRLPPSSPSSKLMEDLKKIPASEVALHSSKEDCWLVIDSKVYDVTQFLEDHPGGEEVLVHASADGDATESFEDVGHSSTAKSMMTSYLIGVLEGTDPVRSAGGSQGSLKAGERRGFAKASTAPQTTPFTLIDFILPLLIFGVAVLSWYMLTFKDSA
ncbi:hypothetical protein Taro_023418, partial [Colocasia esculenta]|nr:hypothetical protein [Colocasia esculenta]